MKTASVKSWHSQEYLDHMQSDEWRATRSRILRRAHGVCEECQAEKATQVHHLNYDRLGHELDTDLQALCRPCHALADHLRDQTGPAYAAATAYENAFETYAYKRWGDDAFLEQDIDYMYECFDSWLDSKSS